MSLWNKGWFNFLIAPIYGWFYKGQYKRYKKVVTDMQETLDVTDFHTAIDLGCGTGAMCAVLHDLGLDVTGIDQAKSMIKVAKKKTKNRDITFLEHDLLEGIPFNDKRFDIAITSYVAHGLTIEERKKLYQEMCRLATKWVIIHDYNDERAFYTSTVEWFEGGNYFTFIKDPKLEIEQHIQELETCFEEVQVVQVDIRANWYICKPKSL
ncbi:MAG: class I SAM-dependent methyltransferase [Candidatus Izemoplasma sp.]|nr:class I SAM-dependent methyltransferase [Candidatus Izemoplasma sp.]